jgi:hypothetical protein
MKNSLTTFVCLLLLLLAGCLEIDGQDVFLSYDEENDRIDAMFVHQGLFAEGGNDNDIGTATKDLEEAMASGEFAFWNNWPLSCDPTRNYDAPRNALVKHLDVENGGLFTDPQGVLCGYQFLRINKAKSFIKKINTLFEFAIQAACVTGIRQFNNHKLDADSKENIREFLRGRGKFVTMEKGRIEVQLPLSKKDHKWLKKLIEVELMGNMPGEITRRVVVAQRRKDGISVTDTSTSNANVNIDGTALRREIQRAPTYRFLWDNDVSLERSLDLTTIGFGVAGEDQLHITKAKSGLYHEALLLTIRDAKFKVEDGLPDQELTRRFEDFRTRDARLPKKLAEKRAAKDKRE